MYTWLPSRGCKINFNLRISTAVIKFNFVAAINIRKSEVTCSPKVINVSVCNLRIGPHHPSLTRSFGTCKYARYYWIAHEAKYRWAWCWWLLLCAQQRHRRSPRRRLSLVRAFFLSISLRACHADQNVSLHTKITRFDTGRLCLALISRSRE